MAWPFGRSRVAEQARGAAGRYIADASADPDEQDVQWLAVSATEGDADRARWELRYARRALALLVAERDALDDRTGSVVAKEMKQALALDRSVAAGMVRVAERQLDQRLTAYRGALADRTSGEPLESRLGRVLLGGPRWREQADDVARAAAVVRRYVEASQDALRRAFGIAAIPEDQVPSAWRSRNG